MENMALFDRPSMLEIVFMLFAESPTEYSRSTSAIVRYIVILCIDVVVFRKYRKNVWYGAVSYLDKIV